MITRGLIGSVSMFGFFYTLTNIPFGTAVSLKYLSPLFVSFFAILFLKEEVKLSNWISSIVSLSGVIIIKGFDTRISSFDFSVGVISAIFGGLLYIVIKIIGNEDHPLVILNYFMAISTLLSSYFAIENWTNPLPLEWLGFLTIGIIGFIAQNYFTLSIQNAEKVNVVANFRYVEIAFALIIGYLIFDETYSLLNFTGIILIILGPFLPYLNKQILKPQKNLENE
jgi:drug/metabolite transporter (DMT)-like permease